VPVKKDSVDWILRWQQLAWTCIVQSRLNALLIDLQLAAAVAAASQTEVVSVSAVHVEL